MGKNWGFTLIELMVTIAVLGIIAAMAAPSMGQMLVKQNLNKSTQELISVLNNARAKAALERKEITVNLNAAETADSSDALNWAPSGKAVLKTGSPTSIVFLPTGLVKNWVSSTVPFTICDQASGSLSNQVSVSKMGTIQPVVEGTCS
ncbi:GspH/FimT family pseudopilin [Acinetobacter haemolyticus]|uniref:GspH/FimT family pseudopilin n=1 Tax=Acinetobacter haemolyticus TaxID=29430 RepID=UPI000C2BE231|nr:type II secretion system protein [Acinetobacter haemolyticus]ATZ66212.1 type II secretion system protein GspH [Acinetobacter haemolyticus]NAS08826.1 prepilin-type N-terminal cleavage/methylation domain-containing protein [Acinetobacter haemolyticus]